MNIYLNSSCILSNTVQYNAAWKGDLQICLLRKAVTLRMEKHKTKAAGYIVLNSHIAMGMKDP